MWTATVSRMAPKADRDSYDCYLPASKQQSKRKQPGAAQEAPTDCGHGLSPTCRAKWSYVVQQLMCSTMMLVRPTTLHKAKHQLTRSVFDHGHSFSGNVPFLFDVLGPPTSVLEIISSTTLAPGMRKAVASLCDLLGHARHIWVGEVAP